MSSPRPLTLEDFASHVGDRFRLLLEDGGGADVVLVEAVPLGGAGVEGARKGFSILFQMPGLEHLPQRVYEVEHPEEGTLSLFLVPVELREDGLLMEAVFN